MNIAGPSLYRVWYLCAGVEMPFQKLVIAEDEEEARTLVPGQYQITLLEDDISMVISERVVALSGR